MAYYVDIMILLWNKFSSVMSVFNKLLKFKNLARIENWKQRRHPQIYNQIQNETLWETKHLSLVVRYSLLGIISQFANLSDSGKSRDDQLQKLNNSQTKPEAHWPPHLREFFCKFVNLCKFVNFKTSKLRREKILFKFPNTTLESNPVTDGFSMSVVVTLTLGEKAMPISFVALGIVGKKWEPTFFGGKILKNILVTLEKYSWKIWFLEARSLFSNYVALGYLWRNFVCM